MKIIAESKRLPKLIGWNYHIENGSHYVRDVTFGEDRSRLRTGAAPQILAALRNLVITLIHRTGTILITATRRAFSHDPAQAFDPLFRYWGTQQ